MISRGVLVWLVIAIFTGIGLFLVKYEVRALEERLSSLNRQIIDHQEATHVLKAEWSHLNELARLDALNGRYLKLQPMTPSQFGTIADLPMRRDPPGEVPLAAVKPLAMGVPAAPAAAPAAIPVTPPAPPALATASPAPTPVRTPARVPAESAAPAAALPPAAPPTAPSIATPPATPARAAVQPAAAPKPPAPAQRPAAQPSVAKPAPRFDSIDALLAAEGGGQ